MNSTDWNWLQDTYWYVLPANIPALQYDPDSNALNWVNDQTVWHLTGYRLGYFWGISSTVIQKRGGEPVGPVFYTMLGSITPEGRVHITFIPRQGDPVIGIGCVIEHQNQRSFEMQMSSGRNVRTAHWAYMMRIEPGDRAWESLPGTHTSVPAMLKGGKPPESPAEQLPSSE